MLTCIIGTAVSGDELYGRDSEINELWSSIENGSVLLVSPRRFGKTSIAYQMRDFPKPGWEIIYLDVESLETPADLIVEIMEKTGKSKTIIERFKKICTTIRDNVEEVGIVNCKVKLRAELKNDWQNKGNHIFESIQKENVKTVFVLDELPSMLDNIIKSGDDGKYVVKLFLQWLRQIRITTGTKLIVCGSIGIDQILRKCDAVASINDLKRIVVPALTPTQTKGMIKELLDGFKINYSDEHVDFVLNEIGAGIPFFVKIFVQSIVNELRQKQTVLSEDIIRSAYHERVLGIEGKGYFEHYFSRLNSYYKDQPKTCAKDILDDIARKGESEKDDLFRIFSVCSKSENKNQFNDLMENLEDDFYIFYNHDSKKYHFFTKVLRDLWLKKLGE